MVAIATSRLLSPKGQAEMHITPRNTAIQCTPTPIGPIVKPCPTLGFSLVSWVHIQTYKFIYLYMTPTPETTICESHKDLLRAEIEPTTRCVVAGCPATAPTVQAILCSLTLIHIKHRQGKLTVTQAQVSSTDRRTGPLQVRGPQ
ncbi:hypothetical protein SFRURICE_000511, partial [Spodoptera frugiperda]